MHHLSVEAFHRAGAFLLTHARPLERVAFERAFADGPAWRVIDALEAFQNPDGGFGHGLEPDALTPTSGALATSVALRRLAEIEAPADHPMVVAATDYLRATLVPHERVWRIVPPETEEAPHAPWWGAEGLEERFNGFRVNPRADLLAQLYALRVSTHEWLDPLAEDVVRDLEAWAASGTPFGMHDIVAAVGLLDAPGLPVPVRLRLHEVLAAVVDSNVSTDPATWHEYVLRPVAVVPRPGSAFSARLADGVERNLDYLIEEQREDGAWWPSWTWGRDDDVWERQRLAWAGVITLEALLRLQAFDRIEALPDAYPLSGQGRG
jgi:hypothetical protein